MNITIEDKEYEVIENIRDGLDVEEVKKRYTDFFDLYDYILGDWAYNKMRLKGFYESNNKNVKDLNNIKNYKTYIKENCAFNCKYFLLKKVYKKI